ncbi:MAG: hemerythrin domain-containing protein [Chloroflexi bacterium]|nr:hemerythrin domain-containing protein [Chloroflexota bacterium]
MTPTEQLKNEHEDIKTMLSIMKGVCKKLSSGEEVNPDHLEQILDFLKTFLDSVHHSKEAEVLYPALEQAGIPRHGGPPIGVMLMEHAIISNLIKGFDDAIKEYKEKSLNGTSKIIQTVTEQAKLLERHIDIENNVIYPLGDARLTHEKQAELLREFEKLEKERIGADKHEEFHQIIGRLKSIYDAQN